VKEALPEALSANQQLIEAMDRHVQYARPEYLNKALPAATCDSEKLYVLDLIREGHYLALRLSLLEQNKKYFEDSNIPDLRKKPVEFKATIAAWDAAVRLAGMDTAFGEGRYDEVAKMLAEFPRREERWFDKSFKPAALTPGLRFRPIVSYRPSRFSALELLPSGATLRSRMVPRTTWPHTTWRGESSSCSA
jgi:hypothetical protein